MESKWHIMALTFHGWCLVEVNSNDWQRAEMNFGASAQTKAEFLGRKHKLVVQFELFHVEDFDSLLDVGGGEFGRMHRRDCDLAEWLDVRFRVLQKQRGIEGVQKWGEERMGLDSRLYMYLEAVGCWIGKNLLVDKHFGLVNIGLRDFGQGDVCSAAISFSTLVRK